MLKSTEDTHSARYTPSMVALEDHWWHLRSEIRTISHTITSWHIYRTCSIVACLQYRMHGFVWNTSLFFFSFSCAWLQLASLLEWYHVNRIYVDRLPDCNLLQHQVVKYFPFLNFFKICLYNKQYNMLYCFTILFLYYTRTSCETRITKFGSFV